MEEVLGERYPRRVWPYIERWVVVEHECQRESTKEEWTKMRDKGAWHANDGVASLVASSNREDFDRLAFLCFSRAIVLDDGRSSASVDFFFTGSFGWEFVIVHVEWDGDCCGCGSSVTHAYHAFMVWTHTVT